MTPSSPPPPPRILVFGAGSLGAVYAWVLSRASAAVPPAACPHITAVCRSNYAAAAARGFVVHSDVWGPDLRVRPRVARSVDEAVALLHEQGKEQEQEQEQERDGSRFDYVLVTAKALPTRPSTAELIRPAVTPGRTAVVLVQNGIGIEDEFARAFPGNPILSAVAYMPVTQTEPAVLRHRELELLHVGTYPAAAPAAHKRAATDFAALLRRGGATVRLHDDVQLERWSKLLVNASWNPVCALSRLRDRQFMDSNEDATDFVRDVMREIAAVAQAYGYASIDEELVQFQLGRATARGVHGVQPSMQADALAGRGLEADAIVGNAVRLARARGVETPMLRTLYLLSGGLSASFALGTSDK
ncbi:2-dehydropantoate 2-reductase [Xylariaceae sp. FL0804]|nr:2-dehydropantoate 2-reductase [Xylariaceae sp. FL0804]